MTIAAEMYRLGYFRYERRFYPLADTTVNTFNVQVHTTIESVAQRPSMAGFLFAVSRYTLMTSFTEPNAGS
jgi:predicted S18 family serine protease